MDNYHIKENYKCNFDSEGEAVPYLDTYRNSLIFQYDVYEYAKNVIAKNNLTNILDVGCGLGAKLNELIYPVCKDIVGIDKKHSIDACRKKYSFGQWFIDDIEEPNLVLNQTFDLIISSDVIEHLVDPDKLLNYIEKFTHKNTFIILSTPERDLLKGSNSNGPPTNKSHVREWNMFEFNNYLSSRRYQIDEHFITYGVKRTIKNRLYSLITHNDLKNCQVILYELE
jgi:SAM-dependent methyltransferase